jgi:hypothetical protein
MPAHQTVTLFLKLVVGSLAPDFRLRCLGVSSLEPLPWNMTACSASGIRSLWLGSS